MKKVVALLLILTLILTTTACGSGGGVKTALAYDIYTQANNAMSNISSLSADTQMTMIMTYGGEEMEIAMSGYIKEVIKSETDMEMEMNMTTSAIGMEMAVLAFYKDGVYYMEADGQKLKMDMPLEMIQDQANTEALNFPDTAIKEQSVTEKQGGQELSFTLDGAALTEAVAAQMGNLTEALGAGAEMTIGDISYTVFIDADGNLKTTSMSFDMEMVIMGESVPVSADVTMDYVQINNVSIDFPTDLDSYTAISL